MTVVTKSIILGSDCSVAFSVRNFAASIAAESLVQTPVNINLMITSTSEILKLTQLVVMDIR